MTDNFLKSWEKIILKLFSKVCCYSNKKIINTTNTHDSVTQMLSTKKSPSSCWSAIPKRMPKHCIIFPILSAFQNKNVRPYDWRCHMLWTQNLPPFVCGSLMCLCEHWGAYGRKRATCESQFDQSTVRFLGLQPRPKDKLPPPILFYTTLIVDDPFGSAKAYWSFCIWIWSVQIHSPIEDLSRTKTLSVLLNNKQ